MSLGKLWACSLWTVFNDTKFEPASSSLILLTFYLFFYRNPLTEYKYSLVPPILYLLNPQDAPSSSPA